MGWEYKLLIENIQMHSSSKIQLSNGLSVGISCIKLYRPHSLLQSLVAITVFKCNFGIFTSFDAKTWTKQIMANMWARNEGWWGVPNAQARQNWWVPLQNWWLETTSAIQIIAASPQIMPSAWLFGMWGVIHCTYLNHASFHPQTWNKVIFNLRQKCVAVFDG